MDCPPSRPSVLDGLEPIEPAEQQKLLPKKRAKAKAAPKEKTKKKKKDETKDPEKPKKTSGDGKSEGKGDSTLKSKGKDGVKGDEKKPKKNPPRKGNVRTIHLLGRALDLQMQVAPMIFLGPRVMKLRKGYPANHRTPILLRGRP